MIKAVIFDWGGVFVDAETKEFFPDGKAILSYCKNRGYKLALAVIASAFEERKKQIEESRLRNYFDVIRIAPHTKELIWDATYKGKDILYDQIMKKLGFRQEEVLIVDDRVVRGIRYGNEHGHPTVWVKKGKFSAELPNQQTGMPTYVITELAELKKIL